ncbi:MAG: TolB family protein, partial [Saprospiraceae bacterium]
MKQLVLPLSAFFLLGISCNQNTPTPPKEIKQYTIEQFYKNEQIGGGAWSTDEAKLLAHSNKTGIYNLVEINVADGTQRQVTNSTEESFFVIDYVPGTGQILYSADKGGNEIDHIYLLGDDGSAKDLTPAEREKANFIGWSLDKKALFYTSNKRNPQFFDLYKMTVSDWKATMVYQNDAGMDVNGISWDEKTLALQKTNTTSENQLFLYDIASKKMTEISEAAALGSYDAS